MRERRHGWTRTGITAGLIGAAVLVAGGCAAPTAGPRADGDPVAPRAASFGPLLAPDGSHRSLATDSPALSELQEMQPWLASGTPWYAGRNDRRPAVHAGVVFPVVVLSQTDTSDRFSSSNGRVTDNFNVRISREKFIEVRR
ncbi:MAG: hypothetical protein AAF800_10105 [Planctomycetota bacterium]